MPLITASIYRHIHPGVSQRSLWIAGLLPAFPLVSFFGNLYYTDVVSTTSVLYCYLLAIQKRYIFSATVCPFDNANNF